MSNPYIDFYFWKNIKLRHFSKETDSSELIWHKDKKDRLCIVLYGNDWYYQSDNSLPKRLTCGDHFVIQKETYHRILKGNSKLILVIKEFEHESSDETYKHLNEIYDKAYTKIYTI